MTRHILIFLVSALLVISCSAPRTVLPPPKVIRNQYIVTAKGDLCEYPTPAKTCKLIRSGETYDVRDFSRVSLFSQNSESEVIVPYSKEDDKCLSELKAFNCEPNFVMELYGEDPLLPQQWGIDAIGGKYAWAIQKYADDITVAIIDTGSDCEHSDLECASEFNASNNRTGEGAAQDENGHGSHVHGIVSAIGGNGTGVAGTVWRSNVAAYKFLGASGSGSTLTAVRAFHHAIEQGVDIISCSFGSRGYSSALADAVRDAQRDGIIVVAAAGNSGTDNDQIPHYPSNYEGVVSVGSIAQDRTLSDFSNYGRETVKVLAPGSRIISTWNDGSYKTISGTSMATPYVTGIIASLLQQAKTLPKKERAEWAVQQLYATAFKEIDGASKYGTIDYARALGAGPTCARKQCKACANDCLAQHKCKRKKLRKCRKQCQDEYRCKKGCKPYMEDSYERRCEPLFAGRGI